MANKKNKKFTSKLALIFIFVLAVVYTTYHVFNLFSAQELSTIVSGITTVSNTVGGRGYVFRDETVLKSENTGTVDYLVKDGEKIGNGDVIADVYEGDGRLTRPVMKRVDREIALLEKSRLGSTLVDFATLDDEANSSYYSLVELVNAGDAGTINSHIENMTVSLNKINEKKNTTANDDQPTISELLDMLYNTRSNLLKGNCITEYAYEGGYFYYYPDGYEELFSQGAATELTADSFYELEMHIENSSANAPKDPNVYGKIAKNNSWYFALALPLDQAGVLVSGNSYRIKFPENNKTELDMTLERTIEATDKNELICVFYCNKLPNDFKMDRVQNAQIDTMSVSGIYVPVSALHKVDGVLGVYVLRGSVVRFRCVDVIYNGFDYCLVSPNSAYTEGYSALDTKELIITNGKNLFDGRILE